MEIEIPTSTKAQIECIWILVEGDCKHHWKIDISSGEIPLSWHRCRICTAPVNPDEYKYTKVLAKYPWLNHG